MTKPIAFMPLSTYPEAISDAAISAAIRVATGFGFDVKVGAFAADMPQVYTPIGDIAFDMSALMDGAQKVSAGESARLSALVAVAGAAIFEYHPHLGPMYAAAPAMARMYDLAVLPWQKGALSAQDMAEAVIFAGGRPVILVPQETAPAPLTHLAVAWNDSAVAARAMNDGLNLLAKGGKVSVLTVGTEPAEALAAALAARGYSASAKAVDSGNQGISTALQDAAAAQGAGLLAMGGFGHSRLRDFVLGGATKGVFGHLTMPVLLSH
jgi:nucleotide-binding universal stress UspA family protein